MAENLISTNVSAQVLKFKPGGPPATFEVTVINESEQFASFQLEVVAAGADPNAGYRWYSLSPEVSSKKPPGDSTKFYVAIEDSPVPGFAGMMNLTVRVSSVELRDEERQVLRLFVQEGAGSKLLKLDLPLKKFQVKPGELIEVPVRVFNPNQQSVDAVVSFVGVEPSWLVNGSEQQFQLDPGEQREVTFSCQPPSALAQAPCQVYPFEVEATHHRGAVARDKGTLEVLPTGFVQFSCTPQRHTIPAKGGWLPSRQSDPVTYQLQFENASNLSSSASIQLHGRDREKCNLEVIPPYGLPPVPEFISGTRQPETDLTPGETSEAFLEASKQRPWLGISRQLLFDVTAVLSDRRVELRNDTHTLELRVRPIIPFWMQVAGGLLALLLLYLLFRPFEGHTEAVTSVRFNGLADRVISGSDDQTIRSWKVKGRRLEPAGVFARGEKSVRVVRYQPVNNDVVAAGLENGEIKLWDVLENREEPVESFVNQKDDRVLALEFTKNSRYLFSSHGSGSVLQWDIERDLSDTSRDRSRPVATLPADFAVYALAAVGTGDTNLAIAGRYNKLLLWNFAANESRLMPYPEGGQDDYIQSLSVAADKPNLMAIADNQGHITLWDMRQCLVEEVNCEVLDRWSGGHSDKPVRSLSLSKDGCYLASTGDDGREVLWSLTREGKRDPKFLDGKQIGRFRTKINDIALILREDDILVVSGSDDRQVRLRSVQKNNTACR
jgi:WD40 repeat protein